MTTNPFAQFYVGHRVTYVPEGEATLQHGMVTSVHENPDSIFVLWDNLRTLFRYTAGDIHLVKLYDPGDNVFEDGPKFTPDSIISFSPQLKAPPTLTLHALQRANAARNEEWPGSEAITLEFNAIELAGECGELMNVVKKFIRKRDNIHGNKEDLSGILDAMRDELGDVVICCAILANNLGLDLSKCTIDKFNATTRKHGLNTFLDDTAPDATDETELREQIDAMGANATRLRDARDAHIRHVRALQVEVSELKRAVEGFKDGWAATRDELATVNEQCDELTETLNAALIARDKAWLDLDGGLMANNVIARHGEIDLCKAMGEQLLGSVNKLSVAYNSYVEGAGTGRGIDA